MAASWYTLKILTFAFTDDTKKTVEIRWDWDGLAGTERDYTDKFEVNVRYHVVNGAGERRIDREEPATTVTAIPGETEYVYYWTVPDRCIEVEMTVVAYSKTYNSNGNNVPYWDIGLTKKVTTPNWLYCGEAHKPDKAATPTITRNPRLGSQVILELSGIREEEGNNKDVCKVEFQVLSLDGPIDEGTILTGTNEAVVSEFNTCRYVMSIGKSYGYKFRARYWAGKPGEFSKITGDPWAANASPIVDVPGAWSDFTELVNGAPNSPKILSIKKENRTQVRFTLERSGYLHHYQFQCASTTEAFTRMDTWETEHPDLIENQEARAAAEAIDPPILDEFNVLGDVEEILHDTTKFVGGRIFFRVRAVSAETEGFYSGWSEVVEFKYADEIRRPVTWMNTPYASVGDNTIALNIMHNSPTNTQTTGAQIMFHFNSGATRYYPAAGIIEPPSNGNVYQVPFPLTDYTEEGVIWWSARTAEFGEEGQDERNWSPWSESIEFWIYEKPVIDISFPDVPQNEWTDVNIENESTTVPIISQFPLHFLVTPTLSGDQSITSYLIRIIALDAYAEYDGYGNRKFVNKGEVLYSIYDNSSRGATDKYINVTDCNLANGIRYRLSVAAYVNTGAHTEATADFLVQIPQADYTLEATVSQNSENVSMVINPRAVRYIENVEPGENEMVFVNNIVLSVYRKNQDGTMVEIAKDVPNQDSVFIKDPHPNLMKLVYRIVGRNILTGAIAFADTPEYKMDCTDIILQWDENTHFMDVTENDLPSEYSGNIVRLPYNIDVSESANIDNNMVKYIGRKDPVSYYGTHTGYTANWNTEIPKYDRDTIALLRKLQVYPGDVYVREPSGTGYWAHVTVTFPINHCALTVSVSLSITRVEGGM